MRFDVNSEFENIEYELLIIDKLMQQKKNMNNSHNKTGIVRTATIKEGGINEQGNNNNNSGSIMIQHQETNGGKNGKKGGVVFNLSKNETNIIYKEE